ncbi:MAG: TGS domain-containing protein [Candidatus Geothermarchaeales archaeon]
MVTNLPEKAKAQWTRVVMAKEPKDKLRELQTFYSLVPKHKGTEKLLKQVKRKMATIREEIRERKTRPRVARYVSRWDLPSHGVGRVSLVGFNRESLFETFHLLTGREARSTTIYEPVFGVLDGGYVQFQVVLLPPIGDNPNLNERVFTFCKSSHLVLFVSSGVDFETFVEASRSHGFLPLQPEGRVEVRRSHAGGIRVVGGAEDATPREIINLLREYKIRDAVVRLDGRVSLEDVENEILGVWKHVPTLEVKLRGRNVMVEEHFRETSERCSLSSRDDIAAFFLRRLSLIRVFTKPPGGPIAEKPIVLREGSTAGDLARDVHSDLARRFKYALLWRGNVEAPLRVSQNYGLEDMDVVEIRAL